MDLANWALRTSPKFTTGLISVASGFLARLEIRKSQSPFVTHNEYKANKCSDLYYIAYLKNITYELNINLIEISEEYEQMWNNAPK